MRVSPNSLSRKLVLAQIKPILGYIVTLDPLGYNANQIDVLFLVLGTIAARLTTPGERQLAIMFQLLRTCIQLLRDIPNLQVSPPLSPHILKP